MLTHPLKVLRENSGLTQTEIAKHTGISTTRLSLAENRSHAPLHNVQVRLETTEGSSGNPWPIAPVRSQAYGRHRPVTTAGL